MRASQLLLFNIENLDNPVSSRNVAPRLVQVFTGTFK